MTTGELIPLRPDIAAAIRGGDTEQGMEAEADPLTGTLEQAVYMMAALAQAKRG